MIDWFIDQLRLAQRNFNSNVNDALWDDLVSRDYDSFWKTWKRQFCSSDTLATRADGEVTQKGIAESFGVYFQEVYVGSDTPAHESK